MKRIEKILADWRKRPLSGKDSFDDIFRLGGIPLGWFFSRFLTENVLPKAVSPYGFIRKGRPIPFHQVLRLRIASILLPKYLLMNELRKMRQFKRADRNLSKKKVLFLSYSNHIGKGGKVFRIQGIMDNLKGKIEVLPIFVDPLSMNNQSKIEGRASLYAYRTERMRKEAAAESQELHSIWAGISDEEKARAFGDKDLWRYFRYAIDMYMSREFLFLLSYYFRMFSSAISKEKGAAVVASGNVGFFERCLFGAAHFLGIPSFSVQHGIGTELVAYDPELLDTTKMIMFSEKYNQIYLRLGVPSEKLAVVGPIPYDDILSFRSKTRGQNRILIATSPLIEFLYMKREEYFRRIAWLIDELSPAYSLSFKLHPREVHLRWYQKLAAGCSGDVHVIPGTVTGKEFYHQVKESDILIHFGSNSALEAMIIGRPTLYLDMVGDKSRRMDWLEGEDIPRIGYGEDILKAVDGLLKDKGLMQVQERIVLENAGRIDGKACERAASLILGATKRVRKRQ